VLFPKWMNVLPTLGAIGGLGATVSVIVGTWYWATPDFFEVGYMPIQPGGGFNHAIHAGKLGMDCRYCHYQIEESPEANIPSVSVCWGCHSENKVKVADEASIQFVREAYASGESIPWRRVHKLPDYVRNFPHHVHLNAGVSCYSCHGQIIGMPVVYQAESLSMGWCLDCHRNPEDHLVPPDQVTRLIEVEQELADRAKGAGQWNAQALRDSLRNNPPQQCGACHH
jgi:hypothetical protein